MNADAWEVRLASSADAEALLALYECDEAAGDLAVISTRRPDPYASLLAEGDEAHVPVVVERASGRVVGMGAVVVREARLAGRPCRVGYLTGLKILPEFRRRLPLFTDVYGRLRALTPDVTAYYTTIMADNVAAQRMLERRRPRMPEYRRVSDYTTWCFRTPRPPRTSLRLERGVPDDLVASGFALEPLAPLAPLTWTLLTCDGDLVGTAGVWDQTATKQYVVGHYGGPYRALRHVPTAALGYPRLPREGRPARYASVTQLWVRDWDPGLARVFLGLLSRAHRDLDFLLWGASTTHPLARGLANFRGVRLDSVLYSVHFDADCADLTGPLALDVALL